MCLSFQVLLPPSGEHRSHFGLAVKGAGFGGHAAVVAAPRNEATGGTVYLFWVWVEDQEGRLDFQPSE